jgi:hypothetical protein
VSRSVFVRQAAMTAAAAVMGRVRVELSRTDAANLVTQFDRRAAS